MITSAALSVVTHSTPYVLVRQPCTPMSCLTPALCSNARTVAELLRPDPAGSTLTCRRLLHHHLWMSRLLPTTLDHQQPQIPKSSGLLLNMPFHGGLWRVTMRVSQLQERGLRVNPPITAMFACPMAGLGCWWTPAHSGTWWENDGCRKQPPQ